MTVRITVNHIEDFTAHHSAMCIAIFSVFFLSGFEKSVLFRDAPDHFHHLKPVQIR